MCENSLFKIMRREMQEYQNLPERCRSSEVPTAVVMYLQAISASWHNSINPSALLVCLFYLHALLGFLALLLMLQIFCLIPFLLSFSWRFSFLFK